MNGKRYRDALPLCACGCEQKVNNFRAKYLPGHHARCARELKMRPEKIKMLKNI